MEAFTDTIGRDMAFVLVWSNVVDRKIKPSISLLYSASNIFVPTRLPLGAKHRQVMRLQIRNTLFIQISAAYGVVGCVELCKGLLCVRYQQKVCWLNPATPF